MRLSQLFPDRDLKNDPALSALCEDSRLAQTGAIFFAHAGSRDHGIKYISDAIMAGCVAIVVPENVPLMDVPEHVCMIRSPDTRADLSRCAALFYPQKPRDIVAVTGTSGKTSTTFFVQQFLNKSGRRSVCLGTLGIAGAITREGSLTTPEAPALHACLADLALQGIDAVAMEASSQALDQHRMDHVPLRAAAFTNLSHDHLDYHGTRDNYKAAKTRLFSDLLPVNSPAILNADDPVFPDFEQIAHTRGLMVLSFGHTPSATLRITSQILTPLGQTLSFLFKGVSYTLSLNIAGAFQAQNIMAAIGLCLAMGMTIDDLVEIAPTLSAPPGRLQPVDGHPFGASVYVDYAHKPDALENVLTSLHAHAPARLICVFGCGGDRDTTKRPLMGQIAARLASDIIVTDDNPRSENPDTIRSAILAGCPNALNIGNRSEAIKTAINMARAGDIVLIAGKGHEQGQKFADHTDPFNDVTEAKRAIADLSSSTFPLATTTKR